MLRPQTHTIATAKQFCVCVAHVFRIWGDLEMDHGRFQDPETAQPSRDGWAQGRLLMGGLGDGSPTISKMGGFATKGLH